MIKLSNCPICNKEFIKTSGKQIYCCKKCSIQSPKQVAARKEYCKNYNQLPRVKEKEKIRQQTLKRKQYQIKYEKKRRQTPARQAYLHNPEFVEKQNKHRRTLYQENPKYKIFAKMRAQMRYFLLILGCGRSKTNSSPDYLDCSADDWVKYLERSGKKINNKSLEIDHIKPCTSFLGIDLENDLRVCFHYSNTRLINWKENIIKHAKFDEEHKKIYEFYKLNGPLILQALKNGTYNKSMEYKESEPNVSMDPKENS